MDKLKLLAMSYRFSGIQHITIDQMGYSIIKPIDYCNKSDNVFCVFTIGTAVMVIWAKVRAARKSTDAKAKFKIKQVDGHHVYDDCHYNEFVAQHVAGLVYRCLAN